MLVGVINVGNSKGIRIPKSIIKDLNIKETMDLQIQDGKIILQPVVNSRLNWPKFFKKDEGHLADWDFKNDWDDTEWEW